MNLFRGKGLECYNCVWHRTTESGETVCGVDNSLPYRSTIDGKRVKHPAWNCEYFIERHAGNETLEFSVKSKDTCTCHYCHNAFVHPSVPNGMIYCARLDTYKPRDSWCENWTPYRPEDDMFNQEEEK